MLSESLSMINSESLVLDEVRTTMFSLSVTAHRVTNYEAASDGGKWGVSIRKMKLTLTLPTLEKTAP